MLGRSPRNLMSACHGALSETLPRKAWRLGLLRRLCSSCYFHVKMGVSIARLYRRLICSHQLIKLLYSSAGGRREAADIVPRNICLARYGKVVYWSKAVEG